MSATNEDLFRMKREVLFPHLPFVNRMIWKVKGTEVEAKWRTMYECITSEKKRMSFEQIQKMDQTLHGLQNDLKLKKEETRGQFGQPQSNTYHNATTSRSDLDFRRQGDLRFRNPSPMPSPHFSSTHREAGTSSSSYRNEESPRMSRFSDRRPGSELTAQSSSYGSESRRRSPPQYGPYGNESRSRFDNARGFNRNFDRQNSQPPRPYERPQSRPYERFRSNSHFRPAYKRSRSRSSERSKSKPMDERPVGEVKKKDEEPGKRNNDNFLSSHPKFMGIDRPIVDKVQKISEKKEIPRTEVKSRSTSTVVKESMPKTLVIDTMSEKVSDETADKNCSVIPPKESLSTKKEEVVKEAQSNQPITVDVRKKSEKSLSNVVDASNVRPVVESSTNARKEEELVPREDKLESTPKEHIEETPTELCAQPSEVSISKEHIAKESNQEKQENDSLANPGESSKKIEPQSSENCEKMETENRVPAAENEPLVEKFEETKQLPESAPNLIQDEPPMTNATPAGESKNSSRNQLALDESDLDASDIEEEPENIDELWERLNKTKSKTVAQPVESKEAKVEPVIEVKKEPLVQEKSPEIPTETTKVKKRGKKRSELEKLQDDLNRNIDCDLFIKSSIKPRTCTMQKATDDRQNECMPCSVKLIRLNLTSRDMPVKIDSNFELKFKQKASKVSPKIEKTVKEPRNKRGKRAAKLPLRASNEGLNIKPEPEPAKPVIFEEMGQPKIEMIEPPPFEKTEQPKLEIIEAPPFDETEQLELKGIKPEISEEIQQPEPEVIKTGISEEVQQSEPEEIKPEISEEVEQLELEVFNPDISEEIQQPEPEIYEEIQQLELEVAKQDIFEEIQQPEPEIHEEIHPPVPIAIKEEKITPEKRRHSDEVKLEPEPKKAKLCDDDEWLDAPKADKLPKFKKSMKLKRFKKLFDRYASEFDKKNPEIVNARKKLRKKEKKEKICVELLSQESMPDSCEEFEAPDNFHDNVEAITEEPDKTALPLPSVPSKAALMNESYKNSIVVRKTIDQNTSQLRIVAVKPLPRVTAESTPVTALKPTFVRTTKILIVSPTTAPHQTQAPSRPRVYRPPWMATNPEPKKVTRIIGRIIPAPSCVANSLPVHSTPTIVSMPTSSSLRISSVSSEQGARVGRIPITLPSAQAEAVEEIIDISDDDEVEDDDVTEIDVLRPWIELSKFKSKKNSKAATAMVNRHGLAALYKCMSSTCCFYTSEKNYFQVHLELHRDHQKEDASNYLLCSYCEYRANDIASLITHINALHGGCIYSCNYCFYRSYNEFQVTYNHYQKYHEKEPKEVITFEPPVKKERNCDVKHVRQSIGQYCQPLTCIYCPQNFYIISAFVDHLKVHPEKNLTKCIKCNETADASNILVHYFNCYGFGLFQCVYCNFGTSTINLIDDHLTLKHPDRTTYFVSRNIAESSTIRKNPSDITCLSLKEINKEPLDGGRFEKMFVLNCESMRNSKNLGNLSDESVESSEEEECAEEPAAPSSSLIIENVLSLNTDAAVK